MASFFKRLTDAAKTAKETLEDSGLLDDVKDMAGEAIATDASESAGAGESPAAAQEVPAGIVDPAVLVTPADVTDVTGRRFDQQYGYWDEEWIGTTITSSDPHNQGYFEIRVGRGYESEPFDSADRWQFLRTEVAPQIEVPDVGAEAFRSSDDVIYFRVHDQVLHTVANFGEDAPTAAWTEELVRRATTRI